MARIDRRELIAWLEPEVVGVGCELLDLEWLQGGEATLRLYIDAAAGVGLDDCERVSRAVEALLDVEDPLPDGYRLEVSSPGPERPLRTPAHFVAVLGEEVRLRIDEAGVVRKLRGRLVAVKDETLQLETAKGLVEVSLDTVMAARLVAHQE